MNRLKLIGVICCAITMVFAVVCMSMLCAIFHGYQKGDPNVQADSH